jgi:hypothetical protein
MVFTHIPSSLCLIGAAFAASPWVALGLLLVRAALSQMDVPTRSSYVMAVVTESERPAAASFTSVPRSLAASISPALAGALFASAGGAAPLVICGVLKIAYDLLLLRQFRAIEPPEERADALIATDVIEKWVERLPYGGKRNRVPIYVTMSRVTEFVEWPVHEDNVGTAGLMSTRVRMGAFAARFRNGRFWRFLPVAPTGGFWR